MDLVERGSIESMFPGLRGTDWEQTSPADPAYNCIGWAAHDTMHWWWPSAHWPVGARRDTLESFTQAFQALGFGYTTNRDLERGLEKIAIYMKELIPSHAARQLVTGQWTSKLGSYVDIRHDLNAIEGDRYGRVVQVMARPIPV